MRVLGVDVGSRRLGLALSDPTASLATPWRMLPAGPTPKASAEAIKALLDGLDADESDAVGAIVVGLPRRLTGEDTSQTPHARTLAAALGEMTGLPVHLQDERLTSREAESRLAERERNWRKRKARLDAAAAAVILQDYLDGA